MITNLPDFHQFLTGKLRLEGNSLYLNVIKKEFNKKSMASFIQRVKQIPDQINNLTLIMKDIHIEDNQILDQQDFNGLLSLHENMHSIKLEFDNIIKEDVLRDTFIAYIAGLGIHYIQKMKQINCIQLNYSKYFQLLINQNQLIFSFSEKYKTTKSYSILEQVKNTVVSWKKELHSIEINLDCGYKLSEIQIIDIMKLISHKKDLKVLKIKFTGFQISALKLSEFNEYYYNLYRNSLKIISFDMKIHGNSVLSLFPQTKNLNSSLNFADFNFSDEESYKMKVQLKGNILKCDFYTKQRQFYIGDAKYIKDTIKTWNLDKVEVLEINDAVNHNLFQAIISNKNFKNIKHLTLKRQYQYLYEKLVIDLKILCNSIQKFTQLEYLCINQVDVTYSNDKTTNFCEFLSSLKYLKHLDLNFSSAQFSDRMLFLNDINDNLKDLSQSLKTVIWKFHKDQRNYFNSTCTYNKLQNLIPLFTSLPEISDFQIEDDINSIIFKENKLTMNLMLEQKNELNKIMKNFSNSTLKNTLITHIQGNFSFKNILVDGGDNILKPLMTDIKSQIKSVVIELKGLTNQVQNSYINFDIPLDSYDGEFYLYLNSVLRIKKTDKKIGTYILHEDITDKLKVISIDDDEDDDDDEQEDDDDDEEEEEEDDDDEEEDDDDDQSSSSSVIDSKKLKASLNLVKRWTQQITIQDSSEMEIPNQNEYVKTNLNQNSQIIHLDESEEMNEEIIKDKGNNKDKDNKKDKKKNKKENKDKKKIKDSQEPEINQVYKNIINLYKTEDYSKKCTINCQYYKEEFFIYLVNNIPKYENISLKFKNLDLDDDDLVHFKNIFENMNKKIKSFKIDMSQNSRIHNQGSMTLFMKLQKIQKTIQTLKVNMAETSIRQKGIVQLTKKINSFKFIQHLTLNFSLAQTIYPLGITFIQSIFNMVSSSSKPVLESFVLIAKQSHIHMDQQCFDILSQSFEKQSDSLKKLHLDFSYNLIEIVDASKLQNTMKKLPQNLEYFHFDIINAQIYPDKFIAQLASAARRFIKERQLNYFYYNLVDKVQNNLISKQYFVEVTKLLLEAISYPNKELKIKTYNMELEIIQGEVKILECSKLLEGMSDVSNDQKKDLIFQFYSQFNSTKHPCLKIPKTVLKLFI